MMTEIQFWTSFQQLGRSKYWMTHWVIWMRSKLWLQLCPKATAETPRDHTLWPKTFGPDLMVDESVSVWLACLRKSYQPHTNTGYWQLPPPSIYPTSTTSIFHEITFVMLLAWKRNHIKILTAAFSTFSQTFWSHVFNFSVPTSAPTSFPICPRATFNNLQRYDVNGGADSYLTYIYDGQSDSNIRAYQNARELDYFHFFTSKNINFLHAVRTTCWDTGISAVLGGHILSSS